LLVEMELSPLEQELVAHVEAGDVLDRHTGGKITDADMDQWGEDREVRASVIRQILLGRLAKDADPHGMRIRGLRITGELDLENVRSRVELSLRSCDVPEGVIMRQADLARVVFSGCRIGARRATGESLNAARVTAEVVFLDVDGYTGRAITAAGAVRLSDAHIAGPLFLSGAQLQGQDSNGNSLVADGLQVGAGALLNSEAERPFTAAGAVRLDGAHITGPFQLSGAQLLGYDTDGDSLIADNLQVGGGAFLRGDGKRPFTAAGAVRLLGVHITRPLELSGAQLQGYDSDGDSLIADGLQVGASAFLNSDGERPFTAAGAVRLPGARIARQLNLSGAQLQGYDTDGDSLIAFGLHVGGGAFLSGDGERPFTAAGALQLRDAHITGPLVLAQVQLGSELDLGGATLGEFRVDPKATQRVVLTGLTYGGLPRLGEIDDWLKVFRDRTETYSPQPYQQLAAAYRSAGHERDARRVLIAQQDDRRDRVLRPPKKDPGKPSDPRERWKLWWRRFGLHLQKLALGYGYRARRAFYLTVMVLVAACAIGLAAGHTHSGSTGSYAAYRPPPTDRQPVQRCSTVEQIGLGLRPGLPFLSTVTAGKCVFDTTTAIGGVYASIDWSLQALAWAGAALAIAGYTGLVRKT
jgi:hypothetical protein